MPNITINPDPPHQNQRATVHYSPNAKLKIEYTPGGIVNVTCDANGDVTVTVQAGAQGMLITDANNSSVSAGFSVTQ